MDDHTMYYDTIIKLTTAISQCKDPEEVALITAESVKTAFKAKGCSVFLVDRETRELGLVASSGLSQNYLKKGPIHFMQSIMEAKDAVPIAIYDVMDDPRIEYPEQAKKEGRLRTLAVLRAAVLHGAVARLRPKFMTTATTFLGLLPIMWSIGTGADVMKRIAAPLIGGIFTSFLLELIIYPVIFETWKWHSELKKQAAPPNTSDTPQLQNDES